MKTMGHAKTEAFDIRAALAVQDRQLQELAIILKPEVMTDLRIEAGLRNINLRMDLGKEPRPHDVFRGQDLLAWVQNNRDKWS